METRDRYDIFSSSIRKDDAYWRAFTLLQFVIAVRRLMTDEPVNQRALAARIGGMSGIPMSPATLSRHLRGTENTGVDTMLRIAGALDAAVHIHVAKRGVPVRFVEGQQDESAYVEVRSSTAAFGSAPPAERTYGFGANV